MAASFWWAHLVALDLRRDHAEIGKHPQADASPPSLARKTLTPSR